MTPAPEADPWWRRPINVFPLGFFGIAVSSSLSTQWIVHFHTPAAAAVRASGGEPAPEGWVGTALLVGFIIQAIANPIVGALSDRLEHPLGRRRPFILLGTPILIALFAALWIRDLPIPAAIAGILLYNAVQAAVCQPYFSLMPSLAPTAPERLRFTVRGSIAALLGTGAAFVGGPSLYACDPLVGLGLAGGATLLLGVLVPGVLIREPPPAAVEGPSPRSLGAIGAEMVELVRQPGVGAFLLGDGLAVLALTMLIMAAPFAAEALLARETTYTAILNAILMGGMVLALPIYGVLAKRFLPAYVFAAGIALGALLSGGLAGASGVLAPAAVLPLFWAGFLGLGAVAIVAMASPSLVLARFADRDGRGREGAFFGLNGLVVNLGSAGASWATDRLLGLGHDAANPLGVQAALAAAGGVLALAAIALVRAGRAVAGRA